MASPNTAGVAALVLSARPGASALDIKSAIMASAEAKPELTGKVGHRRARQRRPRRHRRARRRAGRTSSPPVDHGHAAAGRRAGRLDRRLEPARDHVRLRLAAVVRQRRDAGRRSSARPPRPTRPGASDIGATRARHGHRHEPVRRRERDLGGRSAPIASGAPVNTARPVISGTPRRGQVLTVTSVWSPTGTSYTYQWQRSTDGVTWTNDRHQRLQLHAHDGGAGRARARHGHGDQRLRAGLGDQRAGRPGRVGSARQHHAAGDHRHDAADLHADRGDGRVGRRRATPTRYQWQRDDGQRLDARSAGATASTYRLAKDDEGARVRVLVTATNVDGTVERASDPTTAPVSPFPPANTVAPVDQRHAAAQPRR